MSLPFSSLRSFRYLFLFPVTLFFAPQLPAQESPYIVAYSDDMEEPRNLEIEYFSTFAAQRSGNDFHAFWTEFEYGATSWWTTGLYLDSQTTFGDSTVFTGIRFENRFRLLKHEHRVNPLFYVEYERKNAADKILKEVEGHDTSADFLQPNSLARAQCIQELELKLILSTTMKGWNFSENTLAAKNLSNQPWEFGYALGASRPLSMKSGAPCSLCRRNFTAGLEMYGGLGDRYRFGLHDTSHYLAPVVAWHFPAGWTLRLSTGFGLNDRSQPFLLRWGVSRDIEGFGTVLARLFRERPKSSRNSP